jgi:hypothetical protein
MRKGNAKEVSSPERVRHPSVCRSPTFFATLGMLGAGTAQAARTCRKAGCGHCASRSDMPECCMRALRKPLAHAGMGVRALRKPLAHAGMGAQRRSEPFHLPNQCPPPPSAAARPRNRCALAVRQPLVHHRTSAPRREPCFRKAKGQHPLPTWPRTGGDGLGRGLVRVR